MKKRHFMLVLKLAVSGILVWLVFRSVSFASLGYLFGRYSFPIIGAAITLQIVAALIAAWRWRLFLPDLGYFKIVRFTLVGLFYSLVLPGQITGDAAKAYRFGFEHASEAARISSSVVLDKIIGFISLLGVTCIGLLYADIPNKAEIVTVAALLLVFLVALLFILGNKRMQAWVIRNLNIIASRFAFLSKPILFIEDAAEHYHVFSRKPATITASALLGVLYQLVAVLITAILARSLGMDVAFVQWLWIFGVISLAVVLPITIAGLGVREGLFVYFLTTLGQGYDSAIALSLSILALQCLTAIVGAALEARSFLIKKSSLD